MHRLERSVPDGARALLWPLAVGIRDATTTRMNPINGVRVGALVASGFERIELMDPRRALESAGASVEIISPKKDSVRAWNRTDWGEDFAVDRHLGQIDASTYACLLIPGGLLSADYLRMDQRAVDLVEDFVRARKPVAALCHGVWLLVEANVVAGRSLTGYPSLRTDIENAGGHFRDEPSVVDGPMLTIRRQDDLAFGLSRLLPLIISSMKRDHRPFGPPDRSLQR
jgi:protease I